MAAAANGPRSGMGTPVKGWRDCALDPDWGITAVRVMMGLVFAAHGVGKFNSPAAALISSFAHMRIPAPQVVAPAIAGLEAVGGTCLIVGFLSRVFGLLFVCEMLVSTFWVQLPNRGWSGSELDRMLLVSGVLLVLAGPGRAALDAWWMNRLKGP